MTRQKRNKADVWIFCIIENYVKSTTIKLIKQHLVHKKWVGAVQFLKISQ